MLRTVFKSPIRAEAELIRSRLEGAGFHPSLTGAAQHSSLMPMLQELESEVAVPESEHERAQVFLSESRLQLDGTEMHISMYAVIGTPGEFERTCDRTTVVVGPATPPNSPSGGGVRIIPDRTCVERDILVPAGQTSNFGTLHENWETSNSVRREDGHTLAFFNPYFQATRPSRFYDPALPNVTGRPIDVCYEVTPSGEAARGGSCDASTANGTIPGVTFDDPRSVFDGVRRPVDVNDNFISNAGGPEVWYTNPLGRQGRTQPFPGSIRQKIARIDNDRGGLNLAGPTIGHDRDYGSPRVHAPN